jgi:DnaK suppressor protein
MNKLSTHKFMNLFNDILSDKHGTKAAHDQKLEKLFKATNGPVKGDDVDIVTAQKEVQLSQRLDERNILFLKKVEMAKQKILNGEYGICEDCGSEISQKRLLARPTACMCIGCQEEKEREQFGSIKHRRDLSAMKEEEFSADGHIDRKTKFTSMQTIGFESIVDM